MALRRITILFASLLLVAFQAAGVTAVGQGPQKERATVSKGDKPVPADAQFTPLSAMMSDIDETYMAAERLPKAGQADLAALAEKQRDIALPVSAGTGGGDMPEVEPNNGFAAANVAKDLPFDCMGTISYGSDVDMIAVNVTAGVPMQVDVFADIGYFNSPLDPFVEVVSLNPNTLIAFNDDVSYPGDLNSRVNFIAPVTGTIYIVVLSAVNTGGSSYHYIVSAWPTANPVFSHWEAEPNGSIGEADAIVLPGTLAGTIQQPGDVDTAYFQGTGGTTVVVDVHSRVYDMPLDSIVYLLDQNGRVLFYNDDADSDRDSRFNVILPYSGIYYVTVEDYTGTGGGMYGYILSISAQDRANSPVITSLKFAPHKMLKKVVGYNFSPVAPSVEVASAPIACQPSAAKPTTVIKVKPNYRVYPDHWVTVVNPDGRRSNPVVPF